MSISPSQRDRQIAKRQRVRAAQKKERNAMAEILQRLERAENALAAQIAENQKLALKVAMMEQRPDKPNCRQSIYKVHTKEVPGLDYQRLDYVVATHEY